MNILKQSTAATIKLGPFVDDTDGKTAETALTIGQADIRLSKNGGDIAQTNNATGATHDELGYYDIPLNTTDTGTLGRLRVLVSKAGALPVWQDFLVVTANVFDTFCSTGSLNVNVASLSTDAITAASVKADAVTKIQSGLATSAALDTVDANVDSILVDTGTDGVKVADGALGFDEFSIDYWSTIGTMLPDPSIVTAIKAKTDNLPADPADDSDIDAQLAAIKAKTDTIAAAPTADAVADAVWDEAIVDHSTVGSFGAKNQKVVPSETVGDYKADVSGLATAAALDAVDNFVDTEVAAILAAVDTEVAAIKAKTDNLPASPAAVGSAMTLTAGAITSVQAGLALEATLTAIKGTEWTDETLAKIVNDIAAISAGSGATAQEVWEYATRVLTAGTNIDLSALATATDLATVDTVVDAIKAKTDNLPASPAAVGSAMALTAAYDKAKDDVLTPLGVVDGIVDAIKVQTDKIPATPASSGEYTSALTAIQNDLDNPNQYKADVSNLALQATSLAIKGQTDKIPAAPAQTGEYNAALTAIQADLDNPTQYKADVSALMLASSYVAPNNAGITAIKAKTDNLPANTATALAAIQSDLDNPAQYKADVSGLATTAHVQEVENKIDAIDVTVNTIPTNPLLDTAYTAPDNAGIAAIQEKTEQLTFTAPNKVDASATVDPTGIATSEELDIIGEKVDGVLNKLNVSSVEFVTAVVGSNITILRGDTLSARLLDLGDLTDYASIDFTVKRVAGELDDAAKLRLRKNASGTDDGLLRINGAEYATATDGSIVIDDLTTGDIEIKLNAAATRELVPGNYVYDVQLIIANEVRTLTAGKLEVVADVTRAVA